MRNLFRFVLVLLLAFMFRSPLVRLQQTTSQFIKTIPQAFIKDTTPVRHSSDMSDDRPNGTIATSGLELLTFGTPNGEYVCPEVGSAQN